MKRKIFALFLILTIILSLCSCSGTKTVGFQYFNGDFSPFFARIAQDLSVAAQTQECLLVTSGSEADIVFDAYTQGKGIADIESEKTDTQTILTVKLGEDICFSDGTPLTAKDVVFSMYVYADLNYKGWSSFGASALDGLIDYQYGTDGADDIEITTTEIESELKEPCELTQQYIVSDIIIPVLTEEMKWVESLYNDPAYDGTEVEIHLEQYPNAAHLFAYYYSIDDSFDFTTVTDNDEMLDKIIAQYGCDYELLGTVYGSDLSGMAKNCAKRALMYQKLDITDNAPSGNKIRGVELIDDYTVRITINSLLESQIKDVLGIFVAPFHYYGEGCVDNGDGSFDIDIESVKQKNAQPMGAGEYVFKTFKEGKIVKFVKNDDYFREVDLYDELRFNVTGDAATPTAHEYFVMESNVSYVE